MKVPAAALAAVALVALVVVTGWFIATLPNSARATPALSGNLSRGPQVAVTPSSFWSAAGGGATGKIATDPTVQAFLNGTPVDWIRYGGGADNCNLTADVLYSDSGLPVGHCLMDLAGFKAWCDSKRPVCHSIVALPGESNDSLEDAAYASWIVHIVGFQPDYWAIGNEPSNWIHYGEPWSVWKSTDDRVPSPLDYAIDLRNAITAVRAVDPGARFVGLEASSATNVEMLDTVAHLDGAAISAIAYHSYPDPGSPTPTPAALYALLTGASNVSSTYASVRATIAGECPSCGSLPIFVNEFNAGPTGGSSLSQSYADAVFLAASVTEALRANVTQFTVFNTAGEPYGLLDSNDAINPTGLLYDQVLPSLRTGAVFAPLLSHSIPGAYSVLTGNGSGGSLLAVNTNTAAVLNLSFGAGIPVGSTASVVRWDSQQAVPVHLVGTVPASTVVPPEGILLISWSNSSVVLIPFVSSEPRITVSDLPWIPGPGRVGPPVQLEMRPADVVGGDRAGRPPGAADRTSSGQSDRRPFAPRRGPVCLRASGRLHALEVPPR